jgi:phosphoserine phosphatase
MPRIAFFDVDNTITRGSTLYFLGRGMYNRGFFTKRDIGAWVLANIRFRMTGTEKEEVISRFQKAATDFIGGHDVKEIRVIGEEIYNEFVSPAIWQGTIALAKEHLAAGDEVWLVTASPEDFANLIAERLGFTGAIVSCCTEKKKRLQSKNSLIHATSISVSASLTLILIMICRY